jgi:hypothetical protein
VYYHVGSSKWWQRPSHLRYYAIYRGMKQYYPLGTNHALYILRVAILSLLIAECHWCPRTNYICTWNHDPFSRIIDRSFEQLHGFSP